MSHSLAMEKSASDMPSAIACGTCWGIASQAIDLRSRGIGCQLENRDVSINCEWSEVFTTDITDITIISLIFVGYTNLNYDHIPIITY